jgi:hypothetical protein
MCPFQHLLEKGDFVANCRFNQNNYILKFCVVPFNSIPKLLSHLKESGTDKSNLR